MVTLSTPLKSVLARKADSLKSGRGITTVGELLAFHPTRYKGYENDLGDFQPGEFVVVVGEVKRANSRSMSARRGSMLTATLTDGTREIDMTFFQARGHERALVPGARVVAGGEVGRFKERWQLTHPGYTLLDDAKSSRPPGLLPLYPHVPKLHNWTLMEHIRVILEIVEPIPEPIPAGILDRRGLLTRDAATRMIHRPDNYAQVGKAAERLRYEEAFLLQATLAQRRRQRALEETGRPIAGSGPLLAAFDERLPFTLTAGQREVAGQIAQDMRGSLPMNRLLQGEVGSGKTIVALRAMLSAIDGGGQAALLAPTEVLAQQHHRSMTAMLGDLEEAGMLGGSEIGTKVVLLTGSMSTAARRQALLDIASGDAGIVVGTHALLQEKVSFYDLALVVVDEQHRFGVEQRDTLRSKAGTTPHLLVMTATPIPRTIAMTVFGDMETSTLRELPAGRSPIQTYVVDESRPGWMARTWARVAEECAAGRQAYVVCPRIGPDPAQADSDLAATGAAAGRDGGEPPRPGRHLRVVRDDEALDGLWGAEPPGADENPEGPARPEMLGVLETFAELGGEPALAGLRLGLLHGKLPPEEKDAVMRAFGAGEIDVLVATTVIEVGVDVPNATVMVVRDADRFGVSQLHQLRGRVGRGSHPGLCLLTTRLSDGPAVERLGGISVTNDGFVLAQLDLENRREGDILGARQSGGRGRLRYLSLTQHEETIEQARADATEVLEADPDLSEHPVLAAAIEAWLAPEQADYLEKG